MEKKFKNFQEFCIKGYCEKGLCVLEHDNHKSCECGKTMEELYKKYRSVK